MPFAIFECLGVRTVKRVVLVREIIRGGQCGQYVIFLATTDRCDLSSLVTIPRDEDVDEPIDRARYFLRFIIRSSVFRSMFRSLAAACLFPSVRRSTVST